MFARAIALTSADVTATAAGGEESWQHRQVGSLAIHLAVLPIEPVEPLYLDYPEIGAS